MLVGVGRVTYSKLSSKRVMVFHLDVDFNVKIIHKRI